MWGLPRLSTRIVQPALSENSQSKPDEEEKKHCPKKAKLLSEESKAFQKVLEVSLPQWL